MKLLMPSGRRETTTSEMRSVLVNGKRETLPGDPYEIARILKERRSASSAAKAKARMKLAARKRGV